MKTNYFVQVEERDFAKFVERGKALGFSNSAKYLEHLVYRELGAEPPPLPLEVQCHRPAIARILLALLERNEMTISEISHMTRKAHIYIQSTMGEMAREGLVMSERELPTHGRPAKLWELTEAGRRFAEREALRIKTNIEREKARQRQLRAESAALDHEND